MKHKAKRLDNGEWLEGWYDESNGITEINYIINNLPCYQEIDPSTLCQQVRGTEFFEGDEVECEDHPNAYVEYCQNRYQWLTRLKDSGVLYGKLSSLNWKPTGKNKHDL